MAQETPGDILRLELDPQRDAGGELAVPKKRKQSLKPGRDMCFFPDCRAVHGLQKYPRDRDADVQLRLRLPPHNLPVDVRYGLRPRRAPGRRRRSVRGLLCPTHLPALCAHQVLGAKVACRVGDTFATGTVTDLGRGGTQACDPSEPLTSKLAKAMAHRVGWRAPPPVCHSLSQRRRWGRCQRSGSRPR